MCVSSLLIGCHEWKLLEGMKDLLTKNVREHLMKTVQLLWSLQEEIIFPSIQQNKRRWSLLPETWPPWSLAPVLPFRGWGLTAEGPDCVWWISAFALHLGWDSGLLQFLKLIINFSEVLMAFQQNCKSATFPGGPSCNLWFLPQNLSLTRHLMLPAPHPPPWPQGKDSTCPDFLERI